MSILEGLEAKSEEELARWVLIEINLHMHLDTVCYSIIDHKINYTGTRINKPCVF